MGEISVCRMDTVAGLSFLEESDADNFVFGLILSNCQAWFTLGVKVHENELRDVQTCKTTLASAYVLCCLSAV